MKISKKNIASFAVEALKAEYPEAKCSLVYDKPYELLIATRLAAQCTDARVNVVTKDLFAKYKSVKAFADADIADVEEMIRSCGFFRMKAKDIVNMCRIIHDQFDDKVPNTMSDLLSLPGIGRKTANLILGDVYHQPAIVVDTHCIRLTHRLGLHDTKAPEKVENILRSLLDPNESNDFCHRLVLHGRAVCTARAPRCNMCVMQDFCEKRGVKFEQRRS